jgi:hypothetical protein
MHPAEHRALRELYAFTRQLGRHWEALGNAVGGDDGAALQAGRQVGAATCSSSWRP